MKLAPRDLGAHPRLLVAEACGAYGTGVIARWCADLLAGRVPYDDPDSPSLTWLGRRARGRRQRGFRETDVRRRFIT